MNDQLNPSPSFNSALAALESKKSNTPPAEPLTIPTLDDKDGLRKLATKALVEIIATADKTPALVGAIRELLDRIDGKPQQNSKVEMQVDQRHSFTLSSELIDAILIDCGRSLDEKQRLLLTDRGNDKTD